MRGTFGLRIATTTTLPATATTTSASAWSARDGAGGRSSRIAPVSQHRVQAVHPVPAESRTNNPSLRRLVDPCDSKAVAGNPCITDLPVGGCRAQPATRSSRQFKLHRIPAFVMAGTERGPWIERSTETEVVNEGRADQPRSRNLGRRTRVLRTIPPVRIPIDYLQETLLSPKGVDSPRWRCIAVQSSLDTAVDTLATGF